MIVTACCPDAPADALLVRSDGVVTFSGDDTGRAAGSNGGTGALTPVVSSLPDVPLSVLDLSPVSEGNTVGETLRNTLDLARAAERLGYHRYWLAEHHNMPGIASSATAIVIGHVAAGTRTIRVGAGGIMLPNHAPLVVAEQFGTLAS